MYEKNFKNQAVKEVKNGSTVNGTARKFSIAPGTLAYWIKEYDERMREMMGDKVEIPEISVAKNMPQNGISLQSIKVLINGAIVVLEKDDVMKMLDLFNMFNRSGVEE